jgi:predicted ArsR family transcriptional regulator
MCGFLGLGPTMGPMAEMAATRFSAAAAALTSAFGDPTRRRVYLFARESPAGVTASEVARRFCLHPNVARHHLDKLAAGGYLEVETSRSPLASAGRPSKRYKVAGPASLLEGTVQQDALLVALLEGALALLPQEVAEEMAERVGFEYGRKLAGSMSPSEGQLSFRSALRAVADALTAHGFAARAEKRGTSLALIRETCPFFDAAQQHPVICAADRGMVKGMLSALSGPLVASAEWSGAEWSSRAMGDATCATCLPA